MPTIDPLPDLAEWLNMGDGDEDWTLGVAPEVTLPGTFSTDSVSGYLYTDYEFTPGVEYTFDFGYDVVYNSGVNPPRTFQITIFDASNNVLFTVSDIWLGSPGGPGTSSITFTATSACVAVGVRGISGSNVTIALDSATSYDPYSSIPDEEEQVVEITEPDGWKEATLKLSRDKDFYSLIEYFEGSFIFYGDNGVVNGGIHNIKAWERDGGPDVKIEIFIEFTPDDEEWYEVFVGQLDISLAEELPDNKMRIPIIRDDFWSKFYSRKDTPVDLLAETDLDDNEATPVEPIDVNLISQKIRYLGEYRWNDSFSYERPMGGAVSYILQLDWDETIIDDIKKFTLPRATILDDDSTSGEDDIRPVGLFEAPWDGEYTFDVRLEAGKYDPDTDLWDVAGSGMATAFVLHTDDDNAQRSVNNFTNNYHGSGSDAISIHTFNKTLKLYKGQQIVVYGQTTTPLLDPTPTSVTVFGERRLTWRNVRLATTSNITLSGEHSIDGEMTSADRVLVKNQGDSSQNGVYVSGAGAWVRATDSDTVAELVNAAVYVEEGDENAESGWRQTVDEFDLGTEAILWTYIIPNDERFRPYPGDGPLNYFKVTADTIFKNTETKGFLIHDAGAAIINKYGVGEPNPFYSERLGSELTNSRQYEQAGCDWKYNISKGLHLRGYTFDEKSFFMSFMDWWKGANPIFNLGLSYEERQATSLIPSETTVEALADWENGEWPAAWVYTSPARPHISINGSGGPSGYTKGTVATLAGETYQFATVIEIDGSFTTPTIVITVALLDASEAELDSVEFTYNDHATFLASFTLTPLADGTYIGIKAINNTPISTKYIEIKMVQGKAVNQMVLNDEFLDSSIWVDDGSGMPWTVGSGAATVSLPLGDSSLLEEEFTGYGAGDYYLDLGYTTTNVDVGVDSVHLAAIFYDENDNVITTGISFISSSITSAINFNFTTVIGVAKVAILASTNSGANMDVSVDYCRLYGPLASNIIDTPFERFIRVEERAHFYDENPSLYISNIMDISRKYDTEKIYNKISVGYEQWQAEEISGIDDPQTRHTYATRLRKVGQSLELYSSFVAASLAIEATRRQSIDKSTDYKFDDNVFIIALNPDDVSPDRYSPELSENFSVINNLINEDFRYNIRLTPGRNFLRNHNWVNGGLQSYLGSFYKFTSGEGNYNLETTLETDCEEYDGVLLSEKGNIQVTDDYIHTAIYYEMNVPMGLMQYLTIRENRKKAIGISRTDGDHVPFFIDDLEYKLTKGTAKIQGWTKGFLDLSVIEGPAPTQDCTITEMCLNAITDEFEEMLTDEFGVCITA